MRIAESFAPRRYQKFEMNSITSVESSESNPAVIKRVDVKLVDIKDCDLQRSQFNSPIKVPLAARIVCETVHC